MRKPFVILTVCALTPGCLRTQLISQEKNEGIRFAGPHASETVLRHVDADQRRIHFLFGTIANHTEVDLAKLAKLKTGETLVNTSVETRMSFVDWLMWFGSGVVSLGVAMVVWTPITTTVTGDVVRTGEADAPAVPAKAAAEPTKGDVAHAEPAAPPAAAALGEFELLRDAHSQSGAQAECTGRGGKLPTRAQLKAARAKELLEDSGDVWTGEGKGDEGWIYNSGTGATFLKDKGDSYAAYCVKGG